MNGANFLKVLFIGLAGSASLCFATDTIQEHKENFPFFKIQKSPDLMEKDELSFLNQRTIKVGQKSYRLNIHDTIKDAVFSGYLSKEKVQEAFRIIVENTPDDESEIVGYSLGLYKGKICINPFLGNNAE